MWAILGPQAQTRTSILGTWTAFDAQKQFLANLEVAISSPVDLPSEIKRYQDVLQYTGFKVDFVFGIGLYMAPSDMLLHIGQVAGYNNEIVIATKSQKLGVNTGINAPDTPPNATGDTEVTGLVKPQEPSSGTPAQSFRTPTPGTTSGSRGHSNVPGPQHEDEKTALIVGGLAIGLFMLWLFRMS